MKKDRFMDISANSTPAVCGAGVQVSHGKVNVVMG
jgi:hypothetical protein